VEKRKTDWWLGGVIIAGMVLRICLTPLVFHGDIITQAGGENGFMSMG